MDLKESAAREAIRHVKDGMVVGLGSGSTASIAIRLLGERARNGLQLIGIATSRASEDLGRAEGIKVEELKDHPVIDVTIDGADEVNPNLDLIKGLGGALVREKIVAAATENEIIVVDESKLVEYLCQKAPLPVEVVKFAHDSTMRRLMTFGCEPKLRMREGEPFVTDNGNYIADCKFDRIDDPRVLEAQLNLVPGVVDNGLFVGMANMVIVASKDGLRTLQRKG